MGGQMRQNARDLTSAGIYLVAICALVASVVLSAAVVANAVASGPAWQTISALLEPNKEEEQTKMSQMIESSREIRAALAKPPPPRPPLQPVTASVAHGTLLAKGRRSHPHQVSKLPPEAMDAMARVQEPAMPRISPVSINPTFDRHKVY
jgi:hypothetical protein